MDNYIKIFENNRRWITSKTKTNADFFKKLAVDQNPEYLYIGCSDSRVTAEELMGAGPGDVFVHRNIANMVPNTDLNVMSVIDYAVRILKVKHIVVCGHYGCGGHQGRHDAPGPRHPQPVAPEHPRRVPPAPYRNGGH